MSRVVLETERLRLRHFEPRDVPDVHEMLADDYARQLFARTVAQPDYAVSWVERNLGRYREHGFGLWVMETRDSGQFVGDCGVTLQEVAGQRLTEVGYHVTFAARGKGYATEAAIACLRYAFEKLGAERVVSIVDLENPASRKVAERIHTRHEEGLERLGRKITLYSTERADFDESTMRSS